MFALARRLGSPLLSLLAIAAGAVEAQRIVVQPRTVRTMQPPPGGPAVGAVRVQATSSSISLRWSCPKGASGFEVLGAPAGGPVVTLTPTPLSANCVQDLAIVSRGTLGAQQVVGGTPEPTYSTGFTQTGLAPATPMTYVVRTLWPNGGPADSEPVAARSALFPPVPFSVSRGGPGVVSLAWSRMQVGPHDATGYDIHRKLAGEAAFRLIAHVPAGFPADHGYTDTGVPWGRHEYSVQAVDGDPTPPIVVDAGPPAPDLWSAQTIEHVIVALSWTGIWPGGTSRVLASPTQGGRYTDITAEGTIFKNDHWRSVQPLGSSMFYKIAMDYPGLTLESAPRQVSIPAPALSGMMATDEGGFVRLRWACAWDSQEYWILRRDGGQGHFAYLRFPNGYVRNIFPISRAAGAPAECDHDDTTVPKGPVTVEYIVVGYARFQEPMRAGSIVVQVR